MIYSAILRLKKRSYSKAKAERYTQREENVWGEDMKGLKVNKIVYTEGMTTKAIIERYNLSPSAASHGKKRGYIMPNHRLKFDIDIDKNIPTKRINDLSAMSQRIFTKYFRKYEYLRDDCCQEALIQCLKSFHKSINPSYFLTVIKRTISGSIKTEKAKLKLIRNHGATR